MASFPRPSDPRFFLDHSGQPLRVFVEASIVYAYKIIRALRSGGAILCSFPADAQLILVDPATSDGVTMASEWCGERGKVVLDSRWVRESMSKGRPLLSDQRWGDLWLGPHLASTTSVGNEEAEIVSDDEPSFNHGELVVAETSNPARETEGRSATLSQDSSKNSAGFIAPLAPLHHSLDYYVHGAPPPTYSSELVQMTVPAYLARLVTSVIETFDRHNNSLTGFPRKDDPRNERQVV